MARPYRLFLSRRHTNARWALCAIAIVTVLLSACGPAEEAANEPDGLLPGAEGKSIVAFLDTIIQEWEGQAEFEAEYERLTGIELSIIQPPHQQYNDRLLIQLASGSLPDVCEVLPEYLPTLVLDGIALPLDEFISDAQFMDSIQPSFLASVRYPDGVHYGVPARDGGGCVTYIRKDWLDRLGLPVPSDWLSFVEVLRAFTYDDPDGNGLDDTYGYTDVQGASQDWYNRAVFLDAHAEIYYSDGAWIDGFAEPAIRGAMERLALLYREGLIDPNFATNTTFSARTAFFNGKVGVITYWANHWARNLVERTRATVGAHAEVVPIPALRETQYIRRVPPVLVVTRGADNPAWVFSNFIDRQHDKGPIQTLFTYGVEGFHWSGAGREMMFLTNNEDPYGAPFTKAFVPPNAILNDWVQPMALDQQVIDALSVLNESPYTERLKAGGAAFRRYYVEIERVLKADILSRVAAGHLDIDDALAEYREMSGELQIESLLAELNGSVTPGPLPR